MSANSKRESPRHVLLGLTGSVAAIKWKEVASHLCEAGCEVKVIGTKVGPSRCGRRFVGSILSASLS